MNSGLLFIIPPFIIHHFVSMNHFEYFGIPVSFYPDLADLKQRFLKNSKRLHPDFHTLESEERQAEILELSTQNNDAFLTLSDFDKRLKYLLDIKGLFSDTKQSLPQDFLVEMMEINEAIMELEFGYDEPIYKDTKRKVEEMEEALLLAVNPIMENYDDSTCDMAELEKVKDFFLKRKYLWRIKENLDKFAPASKEVR